MHNVISEQYKELTTDKKMVDVSDFLNVNSGAESALREAIALFKKE